MNKLDQTAAAIAVCDYAKPEGWEIAQDNGDADNYRDFSRAAVKALMGATEGMVKIGTDTPCGHSWGSGGEFITDPEDIWDAMVGAILAEPQTSSKPLPSSEGQGPEITQDQIEAMERGGK